MISIGHMPAGEVVLLAGLIIVAIGMMWIGEVF